MIWLALLGLAFILWLYVSKPRVRIPGPRGLPGYGVWHLIPHVHKLHSKLADWHREYGPIIYVPLMGSSSVMVSSAEAIYEVTIKKGREFGGRPVSFRSDTVTQRTGILTSNNMDGTWRFLRKTSQRHLKQFGSGMSKLESIIEQVGEDMFRTFEKKKNAEYDPYDVIFDTALNNIVFLITGERTRPGDPLVDKLRHYEERFLRTLTRYPKSSNLLVDCFPVTRFLGLDAWHKMKSFISFEEEIWDEIKRRNSGKTEAESLCKILLSHAAEASGESDGISEKDARRTSMNLLLAGVTTTSNTFYAAVNILAHHPDIQATLAAEVLSVCPPGQPVTLSHRPCLPYCRAFLWELLRYTSVVALSVSHRAMSDQTIQGYSIPKDTRVQVNIYAFHHDPEFWDDPDVFKPERFLDENGDLVPADHPNRKHIMPFGAGPRVCLGETLALTRLFLWLTSLVSRYHVTPARGNHPSTLDTRQFYYIGVLRPTRYQVVFKNRC